MFLTRVSKKQQRRNGAGKFATMKINIRGLSVKDECPHHVTIFSQVIGGLSPEEGVLTWVGVRVGPNPEGVGWGSGLGGGGGPA